MPRLIVLINIENVDYETLKKEIEDESSEWFDPEDPGKIIVDEAYLTRANCDDSFYAFECLGVLEKNK